MTVCISLQVLMESSRLSDLCFQLQVETDHNQNINFQWEDSLPTNASATSSIIGPDPLFVIVTLLANCISWTNLKTLDFFDTIDH